MIVSSAAKPQTQVTDSADAKPKVYLASFSDAELATQRLTAAGITGQSLGQQFPGAFIRRLHTVSARVYVGVDPRNHDFNAIQTWLKETGAAKGLDVRVERAPTQECCKAGCGGCVTGPAAPKDLQKHWLKSRNPASGSGYSDQSTFEKTCSGRG